VNTSKRSVTSSDAPVLLLNVRHAVGRRPDWDGSNDWEFASANDTPEQLYNEPMTPEQLTVVPAIERIAPGFPQGG
jgi:hypothetical protein